MSDSISELRAANEELCKCLDEAQAEAVVGPLRSVENAARKVGEAWSGSWLGYHSRVYFSGLNPPPPGSNFSVEWGLMNSWGESDWVERTQDEIKNAVFAIAGNPNMAEAERLSAKCEALFRERRDQIVSVLHMEVSNRADTYLSRLLGEAEELSVRTAQHFVNAWSPKGTVISRDSLATSHGFCVPPHFDVLARIEELADGMFACRELHRISLAAASHLERRGRQQRREERIGTNVFIGHGRSLLWRELKDFLETRLRLPWDEFNRVPVAGVTNISRLSEMLEAAAIAFIIMTAEDEQADGKMRARMNVVHEAGLFQGRLGFTRAIVLIEDGCEEFTNIQGLGQIRFPSGNIKAAFEEIRQVLEREEILKTAT